MASPPPAKRRRLNLSENITVIVGPEKRRFMVPHCFIVQSSEFFQVCCKREWKEATTKTVELPAMDPDCFNIYLQWLYTNELTYHDDSAGVHMAKASDDERRVAYDSRCTVLLNLAVLADTVRDVMFVNTVTDALIWTNEVLKRSPGPAKVTKLYIELPRFSRIRALTIDGFAAGVTSSHFKKNHSAYPRAFLVDLLIKQIEVRESKRFDGIPTYKDRYKYHEHNDEVPICEVPSHGSQEAHKHNDKVSKRESPQPPRSKSANSEQATGRLK